MEILLENKYENSTSEEGDHVMISNSPLADSPESCDWEIPEFTLPYKLQEPHPMSKQLSQESYEWLASLGFDKHLGPERWKSMVKADLPGLVRHIYPNVREKDFLFQCKFMLVFFTVDLSLDEGPVGKDVEKSLDIVLEVITVLMWKYPDEPSLLGCLLPIYSILASSETGKHSIEAFKAQLLEAKHQEECNVDLSPVGSVWKDFWAEYLSYGMPDEYNVRLAQALVQWMTSCFEEVPYRISETTPGLQEYIALRQKTVGFKPSIVSIDGIIHQYAPGIPNSLMYSPPMQRLLLATTDLVAWVNDVYSVYKECIVNKDKHNLVHVISHEQKCSYKEAATKLVPKMMSDRIDDMESAITDLTAAASTDLQPAVEMYVTSSRNWVSGSTEWTKTSPRYKMVQDV